MEWYRQGRASVIEEKHAQVPLCLPQIPLGLFWCRDLWPAERGQRLTACNKARPIFPAVQIYSLSTYYYYYYYYYYYKIKNIRDLYSDINDFKQCYQPRSNIVKDEKGDLVTDCHSILARWRNNFSQLFNVQGFSDVRQTEIHTAEALVPEPSDYEYETAIEKFKRHKSPDVDQISAKLIKAGGRTIRCVIHKLIIYIWNKEELPEEWKESIIVPIYKKGVKTYCSNYRGISLLPTTYRILSNILLSRLTPCTEEITGDQQCGFRRSRSTTDHIF